MYEKPKESIFIRNLKVSHKKENFLWDGSSVLSSTLQEHTPAYYPFYYLQSSDFWKLSLLTPNSERKTSTPSANWIRRNIEYAYINPVLWEMLQLKEYRSKLAEFIIEEKIKTATARSRSIMRMLLNWLVSI